MTEQMAPKKKMRALTCLTLQVLLALPSTMVWAYGNLQESYQEVSYDDLINELNTQTSSAAKAKVDKKNSAQNPVRIGVGFVHSFTQLQLNNETTDRSQNGLQLSAAMNLDTPNVYAEGIFRNFSGSSMKNENLQIQQADARVGLMRELTAPWKYTLMTGVSARLTQASNSEKNYSVNEISPSFTAGLGAMAEIHHNVHLGVEVAGRTALFGRNSEKTSADVSVRLDTSL